MNRTHAVLLLFAAVLVFHGGPAAADEISPGRILFQKALTLERGTRYFEAREMFRRAKTELAKEGRTDLADKCRYGLLRIRKITDTYPHTEEQARKLIKEKYPDTTNARINEVLEEGRLPRMLIAGNMYYFEDFLNTLFHIYPDFQTKEEAGSLGKVAKLFGIMAKYLYAKTPLPAGRVLTNPIAYEAAGEAVIPRAKLPKQGLLKVWMPLPLVNAAQPNVEILSVYPEKYIRFPIKLSGDIGLAYFEIPLGEIDEDLAIGAKFKMTHYEERFRIDPARIGSYERRSALYERYTASDKNIAITPAIRAKAREIGGNESNPYLIAKKYYDHIVYDFDYSYTPHAALEALGIPESVFVLEHGYGDCGAQSMYFAALCRAVGIPARAAGGMQLFPNPKTGCGDHFWAQIYLPNYGWIPVDTSVGQLAKYMPGISEKQKKDFIDYFFGNMDPFRYLIQVDVDVPLIPQPEEPLIFSMVLQSPTAVCREMDESPGLLLMEKWKIVIRPVPDGEKSD